MTYFNLRKRDPETEPEEVEEEAPEEAEGEPEKEKPAKTYGPILTGLLGPGRWIAARLGSGWAFGAHVVAVWAIGFYGGWTAVGIVLAWLVAVLAFVPRENLERAAAAIERRSAPPAEDLPEPLDEPPFDAFTAVLWHLISDAPGTHLKTLTERLQQAAPEQPLDRAAVRAKLGALGIPVRGSVRDAAGKVNEGVHREDLAAWQEPLLAPFLGTVAEPRSGPVATPVTCDVAKRRAPVATPLPRLRRLLSRGAG